MIGYSIGTKGSDMLRVIIHVSQRMEQKVYKNLKRN